MLLLAARALLSSHRATCRLPGCENSDHSAPLRQTCRGNILCTGAPCTDINFEQAKMERAILVTPQALQQVHPVHCAYVRQDFVHGFSLWPFTIGALTGSNRLAVFLTRRVICTRISTCTAPHPITVIFRISIFHVVWVVASAPLDLRLPQATPRGRLDAVWVCPHG